MGFRPIPYGMKRSPGSGGPSGSVYQRQYLSPIGPNPPKKGTNARPFKRRWLNILFLVAVFAIVISFSFFLSSFWYATAGLLGIVGFLFLFSDSWANKIFVGVIPLLLALVSVPFIGDFVGLSSTVVAVTLACVFLYYFFLGHKYEGKAEYKKMAGRAGYAAGRAGQAAGLRGYDKAKTYFGIKNIVIFLIVVIAIFLLEYYAGFAGAFLTGVVIFVMAIILFVRKGFVSKLLGVISFFLFLSNLGVVLVDFIPLVEDILDTLFIYNYIGVGEIPRYILVLITAFYWQFRRRSWATKNVSEL